MGPDRGDPVSPSPRRGTATEKERWQRARLAVAKGRVMLWRSMLGRIIAIEGDTREEVESDMKN